MTTNTNTIPDFIRRLAGDPQQPATPVEGGGVEVLDAPPVQRPGNEEAPRKPDMWAVLVHNDDTTHFGFVQQVMQDAFAVPPSQARQIMMTAHNEGSAVVRILAKDEAETRLERVRALVRAGGTRSTVHPSGNCQLTFSMEPESKGE